MTSTYPILNWDSPTAESVGETIEQFLAQFNGPTWLYFPGKDQKRCRIVTTLLHGNEPSGLNAIHRWILAGDKPYTDLYCFIGSVEAAREQPLFHNRMLPGRRDLNRCFRPPFNDQEGLIAADLLHRICALAPEAVIDIHNTSGAGPSFAIATNKNPKHRAVAALFTQRFIITDLRLGSLMEFDDEDFTITTIECGGAHDPQAHDLAYEGICTFAKLESLFTKSPYGIEVYEHPLRVELLEDAEIAIGNQPVEGADLTLHSDSERHNFSIVPKGTELGWLGMRGLDCLVARDSHGSDHVQHYFDNIDGVWINKQDLKMFMVTRNADIAMSDCLFYFVAVDEKP